MAGCSPKHAASAELKVGLSSNGEHSGGVGERQSVAGVFEMLFCLAPLRGHETSKYLGDKCDAPSLEVFTVRLDRAWRNLV